MTIAATIFKRGQILDAILARLRDVLKVNGYRTDGGRSVHLGRVDETTFSPYLAGGILMVEPGEETKLGEGRQQSEIEWNLPVRLVGLIQADPDQPLEPAESLLGDMDRAIFGPEDWTLGGLVDEDVGLTYGPGPRVTTREPASQVVSAEFEIIVKYAVATGAAVAAA